MNILQFDEKTFYKYKQLINHYNDKEFECLEYQTILDNKKEIYLVIEKGIIKKYKILAYSIIDKDIKIMRMVCNMNEKYDLLLNGIYITDFMVKKKSRNKGIGKYLANHILEDIYYKNTILLQPVEDGFWFWKKYKFENDKISKHETWILKR